MDDINLPPLTVLTAELLAAFFQGNTVLSEDIARLIKSTHAALLETTTTTIKAGPAAPEYVPAVSIKKSLADPDHLLSMIDGKPYKTLHRHLASHGLTVDEYKTRYGLPKTYPVVAPNYSGARRAAAVRIGLGGRVLRDTIAPVSDVAPGSAATSAVRSAKGLKEPLVRNKAPRSAAKPSRKAIKKSAASGDQSNKQAQKSDDVQNVLSALAARVVSDKPAQQVRRQLKIAVPLA